MSTDYELILQCDRFVWFFNVTARDYFLRVEPPSDVKMDYNHAVQRVYRILEGMLEEIKERVDAKPHDQVRVSITAVG
jgi:hypothetical protein